MNGLIPLIFIGALVYLIFSRKGGRGCCGGHGTHDSEPHQDAQSRKSFHDHEENVIDLREDEYTVLPSKKRLLP